PFFNINISFPPIEIFNVSGFSFSSCPKDITAARRENKRVTFFISFLFNFLLFFVKTNKQRKSYRYFNKYPFNVIIRFLSYRNTEVSQIKKFSYCRNENAG